MQHIRFFSAASLCVGLSLAQSVVADDAADVGELRPAAAVTTAAKTELALRYENAEGVARDYDKAAALYCEAAKHGHAEAQFHLGWMYANGRGLTRDDAIAAALFKMAADNGHDHAAKLLQYVRYRADIELPKCLQPDPPPPVIAEPAVVEPKADDEVAAVPSGRNGIENIVYTLAPRYAVDPKLALAVISAESAFDPAAVSPKNAKGLMQLIPETAERFGVRRIFNPVDNISGGLAYLRWLLAFFEGDVRLVLAAYNAGERAVEKYRGVPPYPETQHYVQKITGVYRKASHPFVPTVVAPSPIVMLTKRKQDRRAGEIRTVSAAVAHARPLMR